MGTARRSGLTAFERDVLALWDDGKSYREIARALGTTMQRVGRVASIYCSITCEDRWQDFLPRANSRHVAAVLGTGRGYA